MYKMIQRVTKICGLLLVFAVSTTWAQDTVRVRGTIERVEGQTLLVKSRDGAELKVVLADNALVVGIAQASLSDIKPGTFVGVTGIRSLMGVRKQSRYIFFPKRCVEPVKVTTRGIFGPRAP